MQTLDHDMVLTRREEKMLKAIVFPTPETPSRLYRKYPSLYGLAFLVALLAIIGVGFGSMFLISAAGQGNFSQLMTSLLKITLTILFVALWAQLWTLERLIKKLFHVLDQHGLAPVSEEQVSSRSQ